VRPSARIDDDESSAIVLGRVDAIDQRMFGVGLEAAERIAQRLRVCRGLLLNIGERQSPIGFRLAGAEQIQVGSV